MTRNLDTKQLSEFYGNLYEGTRDEEEEERITEAEGISALAKARAVAMKNEQEED